MQILFQSFLAENCRDKLHETTNNIIVKIFIVTYWDNGILIRQERRILAVIPFAPGIDKPRRIEGVAAKHAADGVGDEGFHNIGFDDGVVTPLHRCGEVLLGVKDTGHSHILVLDLRGEFIRKAIDVDKDAVEFFLVASQLVEPRIRFRFVLLVCGGECCSGTDEQRMPRKIPRGFKVIPVGAGD